MLRVEGTARAGDFALGCDLSIPAGSRVAVMGPSGAGKSTLLMAVAGFAPFDGALTWEGEAMRRDPGDRPVTTLFQEGNLFPALTAAQNVGVGLKPGLRLDGADRGRVEEALARTGLKGLEDRKASELSGGQRGRVALARALVRERPVLLLDEAFSALGPALAREMLDLTGEVVAETGATLLMVTHDPGEARRLCPRMVVVAEGAATGPIATEDVLRNPPQALRGYLG